MNRLKMVAVAAALALPAFAAGAVSASAQDAYRPLTVAPAHRAALPGQYYVPPVPPAPPAYDPYHGPAVLVTGPIGLASEAVALPFRMLAAIFPSEGNSPLVLIGAPVSAAGHLAQLPFRVAQAPFGGPNPFRY